MHSLGEHNVHVHCPLSSSRCSPHLLCVPWEPQKLHKNTSQSLQLKHFERDI